MSRHVHLEIEPTRSRTPGVLTGALFLRVRGVTVLDWRLTGLNGSALALARAAGADHRAAAAADEARRAEWPLFFGVDAMSDRGGEIADLSVTHGGNEVTLSDFHGCAVPRDARFTVPWSAFATAVLRLGDYVVRRSSSALPDLTPEDAARRGAWRAELRERLRPIRARRRTLEHGATRAAPRAAR